MSGLAAASVWPDKDLARQRFDAAASRFGDAAFIHDEARARLAERLAFLRIEPAVAVDVGCAWAAGARLLHGLYPDAQIVAIDSSEPMLARAAGSPGADRLTLVRADAEQLPCGDGSVDLLFANLVLPWCRPERFFAEAARAVSRRGLFLFSTFGPDTLVELRRAWQRIDEDIHVHGFVDMHDLGDLLVRAGFDEPVMDVDRLTVTYASVDALAADLRAIGARNAAPARRRSLTGPGRWRRVGERLGGDGSGGRLSVTVELIFGQAWGRQTFSGRAGRSGEIAVPVDRIAGRRARSR